MAYAFAVGTNTVRVILAVPPLFVSPIGVGDAMNPATWTVENIPTGYDFTIVSVTQVGLTAANTFDIGVLESLSGRFVTHQIYTTTLLNPSGTILGTQPNFLFPGVLPSRRPAPARAPITDLANPQVPTETASATGTLVIGSSGDYISVTGAALVRKLIYRRLMTMLGAFFHLPDYGLLPSVKGVIPTAELRRLKARVEQQIGAEPEVDACSAKITLDANNILTMVVLARLRQTNETISVSASGSRSGAGIRL